MSSLAQLQIPLPTFKSSFSNLTLNPIQSAQIRSALLEVRRCWNGAQAFHRFVLTGDSSFLILDSASYHCASNLYCNFLIADGKVLLQLDESPELGVVVQNEESVVFVFDVRVLP